MNRKYLVLTELFLPTNGGTAVWFAEVYQRLGGKEIHIVTSSVAGDDEVDRTHPNTIHRLKLQRHPWLKPESLLMYLRLFTRALFLAATRRFDAIHAGRALPEGLVALLVARMTGHKAVIYAHGEELTTWGRGRKYSVMRFALRHADRIIANSDWTRAELENMGVNPASIALINPGVDIERFKPGLPCEDLRASIGLTASQMLILSVGRMQRRKGFDSVIRALPKLLASGCDVHYALVGTGEQFEELREIAAREGVSSRVHFVGQVPADDLPRWYNACDVFAMPNRTIDGDTEGFGMVFLEAACCGKPVIAGRDGGTGSAVEEGRTGLRVDGASLEAVTAGLLSFLIDEHYRAEIGAEAQKRALSRFSWSDVARRTSMLDNTAEQL